LPSYRTAQQAGNTVWLSSTCAVPAEVGALQGLEERLPDTGALGRAASSPGSPDGDQAADGEGVRATLVSLAWL